MNYRDNLILNNIVKRLIKLLEEENLIISKKREIQYGIQLKIEDYYGESMFLNIYKGKKQVSFVGNNKNSYLYNKVLNLVEVIKLYRIPFKKYVGVDESGKGDYFGPLVIGAFLTDEITNNKLFKLGVKDCKNLNDERIVEISRFLKEKYKDRIYILKIEPEKYNSMYSKYKLEGKNMNHLLAWAHAYVLEKLITDESIEGVVSDQFANPLLLEKSLFKKGKSVQILQMKNAEYDFGVAAASILSRAVFLEWINDTSQILNIDLPKGAGNDVKQTALEIVRMNGTKKLKHYGKLHFRNTKEILSLYSQEEQKT